MAKQVKAYIKLQVPAKKANPAPPIGPALSQHGLNIMDFCKAFNAKTDGMTPGMPVPVVITAYQDRSFTFVLKQPPVSHFIKEALGLKKGATAPGRDASVGKLTTDQVKEIAEKKEDLNAYDLEAACMMVKGSARSMGIEVEG